MPYTCKYCNSEFSAKRNMLNHQLTAKYCLEIQNKNGCILIQVPEYKCDKCNVVFTVKGSLTRHIKSCYITESSNINNINQLNNINNINNNITNNIYINLTLLDYTQESLITMLQPLITKELLALGMPAVTDIVVEEILQKDGKFCYRCSDKSRNKFMMLVNANGKIIEEADHNAVTLRSIIQFPLSIVSNKYKNDNDKCVKNTITDIGKLRIDGKEFVDNLSVKVPTEYNSESRKALERIEEEQKILMKKYEEEFKREESIARLAKKKILSKLLTVLHDRCDVRKSDDSEVYRWDPMEYFVYTYTFTKTLNNDVLLRYISSGETKNVTGMILHGYSNTVNGKLTDFGTKEIKKIENLGLIEYLHPKYISDSD